MAVEAKNVAGLFVEGTAAPCPVRAVDITGQVVGSIARIVVSQAFFNVEQRPINAHLVFPLNYGDSLCDLEVRGSIWGPGMVEWWAMM
jgi:hypothetical protein